MFPTVFALLFIILSAKNASTQLPDNWKSYMTPKMWSDLASNNAVQMYSPTMFQGDIDGVDKSSVSDTQKSIFDNVIDENESKWLNGTVYYTLGEQLSDLEKDLIRQAMDNITAATGCIKFQPRKHEIDYVTILAGMSCHSYVGRRGNAQKVTYTRGCMEFMGDIQHELLHVLGLYHEISRTDRDQFVWINMDNVDDRSKGDFEIVLNTSTFSGYQYDYDSIMHYRTDAFAIDKSLPTVIPKQKGAEVGQHTSLSRIDAAKLRKAYNCPLMTDDLDEKGPQLWMRGYVPYKFSSSLTNAQSAAIKTAMDAISDSTQNCVKFVERVEDPDYLQIEAGVACSSEIGRKGGVQKLTFSANCLANLRSIQKLLLHALGFFNEYQRPDRDDFVTIQYNNILRRFWGEIKIQNESTYGLPYDYGSVLHATTNAMAKDPNQPTIIPKQSGVQIGKGAGLSELDVRRIRIAYGCEKITMKSEHIQRDCPKRFDGCLPVSKRWPDGFVPYTINKQLQDKSPLIQQTIDNLSSTYEGCLTFVKRTHEKDYVYIFEGVTCFSDIGRKGSKQLITLADDCMGSEDDIASHFLRVIGFCFDK